MSARTDTLRAELAKAEKQAEALRAELDREEKAHALGLGGDTVTGRRWAIGLCCPHPRRSPELADRFVAVLLEDHTRGEQRVVLAMEDLQAMQVGLDAAEHLDCDADTLRELAGVQRFGSNWPVADGDDIPF